MRAKRISMRALFFTVASQVWPLSQTHQTFLWDPQETSEGDNSLIVPHWGINSGLSSARDPLLIGEDHQYTCNKHRFS